MIDLLINWLISQGIPLQSTEFTKAILGVFILISACAIGFYITHHQLLVWLKKAIILSKNTWDDIILEQQVFNRAAWLIPYITLLFLTPLLLEHSLYIYDGIILFAKVALCFQIARCLCAILTVVLRLYENNAKERYLPLNASIQVLKLLVYLVSAIFIIALLLDRSPLYLLSGLGALTAVLLLIFQDTIKGLVASIQISAHKMVAPGDWVELPDYGADGDVLEIGLNTVKIQNFDRTVTTVPTYALTSGAFKNWQDMFKSGGRRIKRAILIDISSIRFYQNDELKPLQEIQLLTQYLMHKKKELSFAASESMEKHPANQRQLTNIGTFRAYISAYLQAHQMVNHEMTCMVRQLAPTNSGLPLELYFFSKDQNWVNYENIQADIFDHLYAIAPLFDLRIFQHPTGYDWQKSVPLKNAGE